MEPPDVFESLVNSSPLVALNCPDLQNPQIRNVAAVTHLLATQGPHNVEIYGSRLSVLSEAQTTNETEIYSKRRQIVN